MYTKIFLGLFITIVCMPLSASAALTITSATVNGGSSTLVLPGGDVLVSLTTNLTNNSKWKGTNWGITNTGTTPICFNTNNDKDRQSETDGLYTQTFTFTAPAVPGLYNLNLRADEQNNCGKAGSLFTLLNAVRVGTDTSAPVIAPHSDITVQGTASGATVTYTKPAATDDIDPSVAVTCSPASGSSFPVGNTTITCTAHDSAGNEANSVSFVITVLPPAPVPVVIASQDDESFKCEVEWRSCYTNGDSQFTIDIGKGSDLGTASILSVTIAKDETSPDVAHAWIATLECYTDAAHTSQCSDWIEPNSWNSSQTHLVTESATTTVDNKHWTAYFTDPLHESNFNGSHPVVFNPDYYYALVINDNGWPIKVYGTPEEPYWVLRGLQ